MKLRIKFLVLIGLAAGGLCLAAVLSGCQTSLPIFPTATPTVTATESPSATATPMPTITETPTPGPTATPEQLGGSEMAYMYDTGGYIPIPEGVKSLLTPSSPDTWKQTGWYFTDGTPYPWGKPIVVRSDDQPLLVVPSFVRGVVEIPEPHADVGGKRIFVVLEVPAQGGSNFVIFNLQDNIYATRATIGISRLVDGKVPLNWAQSGWGNPISYEDLSPGYTFTGYFDGRQIADEVKQYIGQMVMASFRTTAGSVESLSLQQVVEGMLINQSGQSGVDAIISPANIFLPYQSP